MKNVTPNKELLKINMFWMLIIYVMLAVLAFHFSMTLGIVAVSISIVSYICYIILGIRMKKIKNSYEANTGSN